MKNKFPPCPKCGKKGLHYSNHPHAWGWKDYGHVTCRYCQSKFKVKETSAFENKENKDG